MKRRDFLKNTVPVGVVMPALVGGFSFKAFGAEDAIAQSLLLPAAVENDHVLVIIQLNGGNDGLNTVIPLENFSNYVNARTNIFIPEDKVLKLSGVTKVDLDSYSSTVYRSARYFVQIVDGADIHISEISLFHDGVKAYINGYGIATNNGQLGIFDAELTLGNVIVNFTPTNATNMQIKMVRIGISA